MVKWLADRQIACALGLAVLGLSLWIVLWLGIPYEPADSAAILSPGQYIVRSQIARPLPSTSTRSSRKERVFFGWNLSKGSGTETYLLPPLSSGFWKQRGPLELSARIRVVEPARLEGVLKGTDPVPVTATHSVYKLRRKSLGEFWGQVLSIARILMQMVCHPFGLALLGLWALGKGRGGDVPLADYLNGAGIGQALWWCAGFLLHSAGLSLPPWLKTLWQFLSLAALLNMLPRLAFSVLRIRYSFVLLWTATTATGVCLLATAIAVAHGAGSSWGFIPQFPYANHGFSSSIQPTLIPWSRGAEELIGFFSQQVIFNILTALWIFLRLRGASKTPGPAFLGSLSAYLVLQIFQWEGVPIDTAALYPLLACSSSLWHRRHPGQRDGLEGDLPAANTSSLFFDIGAWKVLLLFIGLSGFYCWGMKMTSTGGDFSLYYQTALLLKSGQPVYLVGEGSWGMYAYPPLTAQLLALWSMVLSYPVLAFLYQFLKIAMVVHLFHIAAAWLKPYRTSSCGTRLRSGSAGSTRPWGPAGLWIVALAMAPLIGADFTHAQINVPSVFFSAMAIDCWISRRAWKAALWMALSISIKIRELLFLFFWLLTGQVALAFKILTCLACIHIPTFALLPEPIQNFFRMHLQRAGGGEGFSPWALFHSWFPQYPQGTEAAFILLRVLILGGMLLIAVRLRKQAYSENPLSWLAAYSYVYCGILLFNHVVYRPHFVLLLLPLAVAYASVYSVGPDYGRGVPAQHALGARPVKRDRIGRLLFWAVVGLNLFSVPTDRWPEAVSRLESFLGFNTWAAFLLLMLHARKALSRGGEQ